jgi:acyl dehydratase
MPQTAQLHLEDFVPGAVLPLGSIGVDEEQILAFGRAFDPLPFHTDPEQAAESEFGGLIASGWHTVALLTRLWTDAVLGRAAAVGSPGVDEVRWLVPVRPGDRITASAEILSVSNSKSNSWRGTVVARIGGENQHAKRIAHFTAISMVRRRP